MNYIKQLTGFFNRANADTQLTPTHISLYMALFQRWNLNRFKNPIVINREEIMLQSKIKSKATYHKCMKDLHKKQYLVYKPSFNPYEGSEVHFNDLSNETKKTQDTSSFDVQTTPINEPTKAVTSSKFNRTRLKNERTELNFEQAHLINYNKTFKNSNKTENNTTTKKNNEKTAVQKVDRFIPPTLEVVKQHFAEKQQPELEGERFFNYYQSNGWLVGGKTKMKNWKAATANWMLNSKSFSKSNNTLKPNQLHTTTQKNYAEPL